MMGMGMADKDSSLVFDRTELWLSLDNVRRALHVEPHAC